jgi:thiamine-monophosphate kinase
VSKSELELIAWLKRRQSPAPSHVELSIGDDMASVRLGAARVLITSDLLLDGVHFVVGEHTPEQIGRKAMACSVSDCAAMAVRPVAATASVALPDKVDMAFAQRLVEGMNAVADAYDCPLVGGDTTSWPSGLVVDVAMLGEPWPGCEPVRRDGAKPGDAIYVTGPLGGSRLGHHIDFSPRVAEAHRLVTELRERLHAMLDISDGLSLDLWRICEASGCGAELDEALLDDVVSEAARALSARDGRSVLDHVLNDGEDFELLFAVDPEEPAPPIGVRVGTMVTSGLTLTGRDGTSRPIEAKGFQHFT